MDGEPVRKGLEVAVHDNNEKWRRTALERHSQVSARLRAKRQLLRVSSARFEKARLEYLQWEAFSLWVRAIADAEKRLPTAVMKTVQQRCPGLLPQGRAPAKLLPLDILKWVHNHTFGVAKREGWLDALMFYSVRDPRSQRTWAYWEHCEREWKKQRPRSYPPFERWLHAAKKWRQPAWAAARDRTRRSA